MLDQINLKKLTEISSSERSFLSLYLCSSDGLKKNHARIINLKKILRNNSDDLTCFEENLRMAEDYLHKHPNKKNFCIFANWLLNYFQAFNLNVTVKDLIWLDSSPYIRPLAELKEEYETFAVVIADNERARIFLVSSAQAGTENKVRGNIKNHVKVGGWSQQRYERRRDKQLKLYGKEIIHRLLDLKKRNEFKRIILIGSREMVAEIEENFPKELKDLLIGNKVMDLKKSDQQLNDEIYELFFEQERKSEFQLWGKIKEHYYQDGLAAIGAGDVLEAAKKGRVDKVIVNRETKIAGIRCETCENLSAGLMEACPACGSAKVFTVDLINEIVELLALSGAEAEFTDKIPELADMGSIAALLRY